MHRLYIHPLPVRIWHWVNAAGFIILILTALQIRYVGVVDVVSFRTAVRLHNWTGFVVIANFFIWLVFYLTSDKISNYLPPKDFRRFFIKSFEQVKYYGYGIFIGAPNPHHITPYDKFNPLQRTLYAIVMVLVLPIQCYTGLLLWDVKRFSAQVDFLGGVRVLDTIHVLIFIFFVVYVIMHAYLGALGHTPSAHYKAMFTGYEEMDEEHEQAKGERTA